ncbi:hypothetical protein JCM9534A_08120 [Catenuloplanes indicus JCM 9534]
MLRSPVYIEISTSTAGVPMSQQVSRRGLLRATAAGGFVTAVPTAPARAPVPYAVRELEERIRAGMERYGIAGAALGLWYRGRGVRAGLRRHPHGRAAGRGR